MVSTAYLGKFLTFFRRDDGDDFKGEQELLKQVIISRKAPVLFYLCAEQQDNKRSLFVCFDLARAVKNNKIRVPVATDIIFPIANN